MKDFLIIMFFIVAVSELYLLNRLSDIGAGKIEPFSGKHYKCEEVK